MSLNTDRQTFLMEEIARLKAEQEAERRDSRIKDLESIIVEKDAIIAGKDATIAAMTRAIGAMARPAHPAYFRDRRMHPETPAEVTQRMTKDMDLISMPKEAEASKPSWSPREFGRSRSYSYVSTPDEDNAVSTPRWFQGDYQNRSPSVSTLKLSSEPFSTFTRESEGHSRTRSFTPSTGLMGHVPADAILTLPKEFQGDGRIRPHTSSLEEEESFVYKLEERDSSSEIGQYIIEADQNRSNGPAHSSPSYTIESHRPASTSLTAESEATFRASDLGEVFLWPRRMRCAFMTISGDRSTGPIGDPFQAMKGWAVYLEVDAGRHGRPNISLHFIINNGKKDAPLSRNQDQRTEFAITWRTGVVNDQRQMIGSFEAKVVSDHRRSRMPHFAIVDICPEARQQELTKLVFFKFLSNSIEKPGFSATTKKLWRGLPIDVQQCLDTLFFQDESRWVAIWFCVDSTPELAMSGWISVLQRAVNRP